MNEERRERRKGEEEDLCHWKYIDIYESMVFNERGEG